MRNYYHCILEVEIDEGCLPQGSDAPLRLGIERAAENIHESAKVINCWSGWGLSQEGAMNVLNESCKSENIMPEEDIAKR